MKVPPSQVLVLSTPDSTVFLGPPGAWGMSELGSVAVLDKPVESFNDRQALDTLEGLKRDDWQVAKLRNYLAGPAVTVFGSVTVRTTRHDAGQVFGSLRTHLRSHRLRAVVIRNHVRSVAPSPAQRGAAGPQALPGAASGGPAVSRPGLPGTLPQGGSLPAVRPPANVAGWSTRDRLMALLHDTLPLLGPDLRAHLAAMTSTEAMAHLLAGMALMAGLQAVPVVGEAADAVFLGVAYAYAGWDGLRAVVHLVRAVRAAVGARSEAEIAQAAPGAADALITLGGAFLDAVALRMAKRSTSGGGAKAATEKAEEQEVSINRGAGIGKSPKPVVDSPLPATTSLGKVLGEYSAVDPGPLDDNLAATFSGGRYKVVQLEQDTTLYRGGTASQPLGQFFSEDSPQSVLQTRIDKAVLPVWPGGGTSPLDTSFAVKIPAGTQVYVGEVGSQRWVLRGWCATNRRGKALVDRRCAGTRIEPS